MNELEQLFEDEEDESIKEYINLLSEDEKEALSIVYRAIRALPQNQKDALCRCITHIRQAKARHKDV